MLMQILIGQLILLILCKVLELLIEYSIVDLLFMNGLHNYCQHGICTTQSCVTDVDEVTEDLTKTIVKIPL